MDTEHIKDKLMALVAAWEDEAKDCPVRTYGEALEACAGDVYDLVDTLGASE